MVITVRLIHPSTRKFCTEHPFLSDQYYKNTYLNLTINAAISPLANPLTCRKRDPLPALHYVTNTSYVLVIIGSPVWFVGFYVFSDHQLEPLVDHRWSCLSVMQGIWSAPCWYWHSAISLERLKWKRRSSPGPHSQTRGVPPHWLQSWQSMSPIAFRHAKYWYPA